MAAGRNTYLDLGLASSGLRPGEVIARDGRAAQAADDISSAQAWQERDGHDSLANLAHGTGPRTKSDYRRPYSNASK